MKKKLLMTVMGMVLSLSIVACGASTNDTNISDSDIKELQERIEELEEENAELKAAQGKIEEVNTSEPETWADDYVIAFCDSRFTENVQKITGKSSDITYGDVKGIRDIGFNEHTPYSFNSLDSFKYFTSLEVLCINTSGEDLRGLENLTSLTELKIRNADNLKDISALANLTNLTHLEISDSDLTDISAIENLTNLTYLKLDCSEKLIDVTAITNLENLTHLKINCSKEMLRSEVNINAFDNLTNISRLTINGIEFSINDIIENFEYAKEFYNKN